MYMKRFSARVFLLTYLPAINFLPAFDFCLQLTSCLQLASCQQRLSDVGGETIKKQISFHGRLEKSSPLLNNPRDPANLKFFSKRACFFRKICYDIKVANDKWFPGQAVKTSPSHGENRGSTPLRTTLNSPTLESTGY